MAVAAAAVPYLAVASFVAAGAGAYVAYKGAKDSAKMGAAGQALQREQIASEQRTAALQAREQEAERQRRAGLAKSANRATAAGFGLDAWLSPTLGTMDAENDRMVTGDLSAIRLLGAAQQSKYMLQDRGAAMSQEAYAAAGANAWVAPTISLLGSGASLGMTVGTAPAPKGSKA